MTNISYFNDRRTPARVYCEDLFGPGVVLQPASYGLFELNIPVGAHLFIKVWETNVVLISHFTPTINMTSEVSND